jgi:type 1 fimbria pilin
MKNKKTFIGVIAAALIVAAVVVAAVLILNINSSHVSVEVTPPPEDSDGGSTIYKTTGDSNAKEANKAILKEVYKKTDNFRAIKDEEAEEIAKKIDEAGCGKIKSSFIGAPPVGSATHWHNFTDGDHGFMDVYLLDDKYQVALDCSK